jgi:hypothetical protein
MKLLFLTIVAIFFTSLTATAQQTLKQKISGKMNLKEIMQIVTTHLAQEAKETNENDREKDEIEKEIYHWQRWAKQNEHRVDGNGNLYYNTDSIIQKNFDTYKINNATLINTPQNPASNTSAWISMGPHDVTYTAQSNSDGLGRVNCIAFHPTDANTLLIGTPQAGIWKTTNGGDYWYNINDGLANMGISGVTFDRTNPNIIIALTGDGDCAICLSPSPAWIKQSTGIIKSYDGGNNWVQVHNFGNGINPSGVFGYKILQHPNSGNIFFAATNNGIFKSIDNGNTWNNVQTGNFTDIEVKPDGIGAIIYATNFTNGGTYFFRSTNTGQSWSGVSIANISGSTRSNIAVSANSNNDVYLLAGRDINNTPATAFQGVFKSTDNGQTFTRVFNSANILGGDVAGAGNGDQSWSGLGLAVNPADANTVITGCYHVWRSTNGNTNPMTFTRATWWGHTASNNNTTYMHADVHMLAYNPLNNNLYSCHDGGVSVSTDHGINWQTKSSNLHINAGVFGDWFEGDPSIICVGTQDNGTVYRYISSNNYKTIGGGDGADALINQNNKNDIIYAATGNIFQTTNPGVNQTGITPASSTWLNNFYPILARNYSDDNNIFAGGANKLYRSINRGNTWDSCTGNFNCTTILTTCRSNTNTIYTGNTGALYRSDNGGATLTLISNGTAFNPFGMPIADVEATHAISGFVYACLGGYSAGQKVFFSSNSGATWVNISGSLPNVACHSIILDAANNAYLGTDVGVFVKPNGQNDWRPYFNGLPRTAVQDLMVNQTFNRLIAITFGHGNFFTDLYTNTCPTNTNLTGNISGNQFIEAGNITADATVQGGLGTTVSVSGTTDVYLLPGFNVAETNSFRAYNAPCGAVGVPQAASTINNAIPVNNIVLKGTKNSIFPSGHLNSLPNNIYKIFYEGAGEYAIRITDVDGNVVAPTFIKTNTVNSSNNEIFNPQQYNLPLGFYYIQLLKNKTLIHFLEYQVK